MAPSQWLLSGCSGLWRGQCGPAGPTGQQGCSHRGGGTGIQARGCRCGDAPSKDSKVKIKCLELARGRRRQEGARVWREPLDEGGVFSTGATSSQQPRGLGGIFSSASQAMNMGLIRGGFERMVVDKEEKYLAFFSHHNKPRCLDGGSPLPTGMESHSCSCASSAEALSLLL